MILSWIVSMVLKSKFKKYSKIPVDNGMSGRDVAERMLRDNGISDVKVESVRDTLPIIIILKTKQLTSVRMYIMAEIYLLLQLLLMNADMQFSMQQLMPGLDSDQKWYRL